MRRKGRGSRLIRENDWPTEKLSSRQRPSSAEGIDATQERSGSKPSVSRKKGRPGRKREARSTGRYPFLAWMNKYFKNCGLGETTIVERRRRLKRIYRDLQYLQSDGKISTTNPEKMTEQEVGAFVELMIERGKQGKDFQHDISALRALLNHADNMALDHYRNIHANQFRRSAKVRRHPPFEMEEFDRIVHSADLVYIGNWNKMESYAIVILGLASGARHKELREGKLSDLNLKPGKESYHIEHPKGEDTYGEARDPPLRPECIPFLRRYFQKRREMNAKGPDNLFLFPAFRDKIDGKLSANSITKMVRAVGKDARVDGLDLHKCRRTFGQMLLDEGMGIEDVSVLMGHASTAPTERYYCRRKQQQASVSARNLWGRNAPPVPEQKSMPDVKNPLIDDKFGITGYG